MARARREAEPAPTILTIGHSTRSFEELGTALRANGVECVIDVRRFPGSRRLPQFSQPALEASLGDIGIAYAWVQELGGRRRPGPDSPSTGWRHPAFRAYADHLTTPEFADGLATLLDVATGLQTAIMCAEVLWWRCHRRLIADVLVSLGYPVVHVRDATHAEPHRLTPPARLVRGRLDYSAPE